MLLLMPFVIVMVPPSDWESPPVALRSPRIVSRGAVILIPVPLRVRLLNSVEPDNDLEIVLLFPVITTALLLGVKVPLAVQLPATVCVALPPSKVALASIITSPPTIMLAAAVDSAEPVLVKLPAMLIAVAGSVLVFELESVRWW